MRGENSVNLPRHNTHQTGPMYGIMNPTFKKEGVKKMERVEDEPLGPLVLLVDDEEEIRRAMVRSFRKAPFRIITAGSAAEALKLLDQEPVRVLVSDARMPGEKGIDLIKKTRELHPEVVRIMFSGYIETETLIEAINEGEVFRFITKPWDPGTFRSFVMDGLGRYELQKALVHRAVQAQEGGFE